MAVFRIPSSLREHCGGRAEVEVEGADLGAALRLLEARYPALAERITTADGSLREFVRLLVNDHVVENDGADSIPLGARDSVALLPAVCGG